MSLTIRTLPFILAAFLMFPGCGYNPKSSGGGLPSIVEKGTAECLYPDAGCHAIAGTGADSWAISAHANTDNDPAFGYTDDNCTGCHNPVEDGRNDSAYLFTSGITGGSLGTTVRPIVGCEACHGAGMEHYAYNHTGSSNTPDLYNPPYDPAFGDTHYVPAGTAYNTFANPMHLTSCGPCHSPNQHAGGASLNNAP